MSNAPRILLLATSAARLADEPGVTCRAPLVVVPRFADVKSALAQLHEVRAVALLSVHAVEVLVGTLLSTGRDVRALAGSRILAVAGATREALAQHGLLADVVGEGGGAQLAEVALDGGIEGPVLVFGAKDGRAELADRLTAANVRVRRVDAYETVVDQAALREAVAEHARAPFAALGVGSPKIAAAWHGEAHAWPAVVGALGETTASALRELGAPRVVVAPHPSLGALVASLRQALSPDHPPVAAALAVCDEIE